MGPNRSAIAMMATAIIDEFSGGSIEPEPRPSESGSGTRGDADAAAAAAAGSVDFFRSITLPVHRSGTLPAPPHASATRHVPRSSTMTDNSPRAAAAPRSDAPGPRLP